MAIGEQRRQRLRPAGPTIGAPDVATDRCGPPARDPSLTHADADRPDRHHPGRPCPLVEEEVAFPDHDKSFRDLVSKACLDLGVEEVPRPSHRGIEDSRFCVDCLHDATLWGGDHLGDSIFVDLPPEQSRALKQNMGVSDGYFLAVAPDPTLEQVANLLGNLLSLCQEVAEEGCPKKSTVRKPRRPRG